MDNVLSVFSNPIVIVIICVAFGFPILAGIVKLIQKKFFPKKVYKTTIPRNVRLSEAPSFGQPIIYFDRSSKGAAAYRDFTDEFLAKQSKITD